MNDYISMRTTEDGQPILIVDLLDGFGPPSLLFLEQVVQSLKFFHIKTAHLLYNTTRGPVHEVLTADEEIKFAKYDTYELIAGYLLETYEFKAATELAEYLGLMAPVLHITDRDSLVLRPESKHSKYAARKDKLPLILQDSE